MSMNVVCKNCKGKEYTLELDAIHGQMRLWLNCIDEACNEVTVVYLKCLNPHCLEEK